VVLQPIFALYVPCNFGGTKGLVRFVQKPVPHFEMGPAGVKKTRQNKDWRVVDGLLAASGLTELKWTIARNIGKIGVSAPFPRDQD
jgi:hypothetical protein